MRQRLLVIGATLLAMLVLAACGKNEDNTVPDVEFQDRIIATASSTTDPSVLDLTWFTAPCERFDQVLVELDEQYANLTIRVTVDADTCPEGSTGQTSVDLGAPLGDREIWDRAFGDTVALDAG